MRPIAKIVALFSLAHFSHHVLTALIVPLLPFMRNDLGLSYSQAGIVLSAFSLSYGIGQIPAGALADRIGPKIVLTVGIAGVGVAGIFVGFSSGYALLLGSLVLMGLAGGGYHPAASPLITAAVDPSERGKALGVHVIGGSASHFAAPLIGAALAGLLGWRGTFLALSVPVMLLGLYFYKAYGKRQAEEIANGKSAGAEEEENKPFTAAVVAELVVFIVLVTATGSVLTSAVSFVPLFLVDSFGMDEKAAAAFISIFYVAGLWAAPVGGRLSDRIGRRKVVSAIAVLTAAGLMLLPFAPNSVGFGALLFILGTMMFARMPPGEAHIIGITPKRVRSTVMGAYYFAGMEGSGILTPLLGALIDSFGFNSALFYMGAGLGALSIVCACLIFLMRRSYRR